MPYILLTDDLHRRLLQTFGISPLTQDEVDIYSQLAIQEVLDKLAALEIKGINYNPNSDEIFSFQDQYFSDYESAIGFLLDDLSTSEKFTPPKEAQSAAKKVLRWKKEHPDEIEGMTEVGWKRARQLASGEPLSFNIVKRMSQFARHRKNSKIAPEHEGKPWQDAGYVAWLGWGDDVGINWANRIVERVRGNANDDAITDAGENKAQDTLTSDAYDDLTPTQQQAFGSAIARMETQGQLAKEDVNYRSISPYGTSDRSATCFHCAFVSKDSPNNGATGCAIVAGAINASGWCNQGIFPPKWVDRQDQPKNLEQGRPPENERQNRQLKSQKNKKRKQKRPLGEIKQMDKKNISPKDLLPESEYDIELTPEVIEEAIAGWNKNAPELYQGILETEEVSEETDLESE